MSDVKKCVESSVKNHIGVITFSYQHGWAPQ